MVVTVSVVEPPLQIVALPMEAVGKGLTVTVLDAVPLQLVIPSVTVTLYVVVEAGDILIEAVLAPVLHK